MNRRQRDELKRQQFLASLPFYKAWYYRIKRRVDMFRFMVSNRYPLRYMWDEGFRKTARNKRETMTPTEMRRRKLNRKHTREVLRERDGDRCNHCHSYTAAITIDHIIPLSKGGTNKFENLQLLCRDCHDAKDNPPAKLSTVRRPPKSASITPSDTLNVMRVTS